ncbi:hypothetical protein F6U93_00460 [Tamlana haliotis]|uniref:Outer membrane protein beta-barrel domain-containing protein n=1 Tax=Pseudotamlana haliotis TaxID=2614804 RepID=A0A6N6MMF7_9FLAO|nr:hypothetical protein [Tamlana haliotis]KAB1071949.1 hypothetical protein F6U93_00460 [Tamlana haliotis]
MKKLLFVAVISLFSLSSMNAQTFKIGGSVGIPVGDGSDFYTVAVGVDAYYYFTDIDDFVNLGVTSGFRNFFGEDFTAVGITIEASDLQFVPIAAAARLKLLDMLSAGLDIGYAIGVSNNFDGGFYLKPVVSLDINDAIEVFTSYESVFAGSGFENGYYDSGDFYLGNINAGILFQF